MQELIEKAQGLYNRCKDFPEKDPVAMIALIELRNLVPDLLDQLRRAGEYVELHQLRETRQQPGGKVG